MPNVFSRVRLFGTFSADGVSADPTTVTLRVIAPDGGATDYVWPSGALTRQSVGVFYADVDLNAAGTWRYAWRGSGSVVVTSADEVVVVDGNVFG